MRQPVRLIALLLLLNSHAVAHAQQYGGEPPLSLGPSAGALFFAASRPCVNDSPSANGSRSPLHKLCRACRRVQRASEQCQQQWER